MLVCYLKNADPCRKRFFDDSSATGTRLFQEKIVAGEDIFYKDEYVFVQARMF